MLDDTDVSILKEVHNSKGDYTTTSLAKKIFNAESPYELKIKENFVRGRLFRLMDLGLITATPENGRRVSFTIHKSLIFAKGDLVINRRVVCKGNFLICNIKGLTYCIGF